METEPHYFAPESDRSCTCFYCGKYLTDPLHINVEIVPSPKAEG